MNCILKRTLSFALAVLLLVSVCPVTVNAATYRTGAQSGPSSSYAGGRYYANYKRVPLTGDNRTDLVAIALSQLGYQEGAGNGYFSGEVSGRNNYVEFSYNMGDLGLGYGGSDYPWCASFVSWCLYQSHCTDQATWKDLGRYHVGDYQYIWKEISCSQWVRQLKGAGYYKYSAYEGGSYTPKYGDLVFFQNSGGVAHIGICLYVSGGRIYTVEGNTSDSSGLEANGGGVYFKNYSLSTSYINGYGVLPYKSDSSVTKIDYSGANPTPGLYVANAGKYIYATETATSYSWIMDRFTMFEVTQVCSNGRLKVTAKERGGSTVTGYISNNSDRVIQLSSTATDGTETARANAQAAVNEAGKIRHYNYTEAKILEIREAYNNAKTLIANTSATEAQLNSAATTLRNLLAQTGSNTIALNNKGVYINGRNSVIGAGDCFIYSNLWNNGLITVDNANIRYTLNVVCTWDAERQINVVKSITEGTGSSTPSIQLGTSEWLIACHDWETGIAAGDNPVEYSGTNYSILKNLSVGDGVLLSGCTALNANTDVSPAAFLKFIPKEAVRMTAENQYVGNGQAVLFTPDFNGGVLTPANANIHNTVNVIGRWDSEQSAWVVASKSYGSGVADETSNIQIVDGQVVIACHVGDSTSSAYYYNQLAAVKVGQKIIFSGISPTDGTANLSLSANISFGDGAVEEEEPEQPAAENLALNKDYTVLQPGTAAHAANLTDGVYTDALDFAGGWFGFASAGANMNTDASGNGYVTVDLGGRYNLSSFRAHLFYGNSDASIGQPGYINVYTSANGERYDYVSSLSIDPAANVSYWAEAAGDFGTARYVRFEVGGADNATWVFLNELEVYGTALTGTENIALGTTVETPGYDCYDAGLVDGVVGESIDDGCWYGIDTTAGTGSVVIDLLDRYQISDVKAHFYAGSDYALPTAVSVFISADGTNYAKVGELPVDAAASAPFWASLTADTMVGRYVMLQAVSENEVTLLSEVEIVGKPYVPSGDGNIAMGKDTVVSPYADSPFTALLNDSLASDVFQYNVNNSAWFGFKNTGDAATGNVTNNRGIITMDLGGQAEITGVSFHLFAGANDAGAVQPGYINVYYSTDGAFFDYVETINPDKTAEGAYWLSSDYTDAPVNARFIKFALGTNVGDLVLLNEVKVNGVMLTAEGDSEVGTLSNVTLAGSFNGWNSTPNMLHADEVSVSTTVTLEAGNHEFKILYGNEWYGNNGTITDTTGDNGWVLETGTNNCILSASRSGNYEFILNRETMELRVAYVPESLYLRGSFNDWGTELAMVDNGIGSYTASVTLEAGTHEFKVANADYSSQWPASNYVLELANKSEVTVMLDIYSNTVTVTYVAAQVNVTFVDYDGTVLSTQTVTAGQIPTAPADPTRASDGTYNYTFSGWTPTIAAVNEDTTYTATYEATAIRSIKARYPSLSFEEEIFYNVYFETTGMEDVPLENMGLITFDTKLTDGTVDDAVDIIPGARSYSSTLSVVSTHGIPAKKLGDKVYFKVYAQLADGSYVYSKVYNYSAVDYALDRLANSSSTKMKALCVAMLNYGAAAQVYFDYNADNPMNACLSEEQLALVQPYAEGMVTPVTAADAAKIGEFANTKGYSSRKPSVTFEGAFSISYYLIPKNTPVNGVTLYYWTQETYNSVDVLTRENADGVIPTELVSGTYRGTVSGIAAKEVDQPVYVAGVYEFEGASYATGVMVYSLGAYCVDRITNGSAEMQPLAAATAVYGYYAKDYFANL